MIIHKTKRLILRGWRREDYAPFARLNADPFTMRYFPAPLSQTESDALADRISELITTNGWGFWAVELPDMAPFIGFVGLHSCEAAFPFSPCVEIGWRLDRRYWGQGYATEAANFALDYGFEHLGLDEIVAFTAVSNTPSRAVMARIGMRDRNETFDHPALAPESPLARHVLYRLPRDDWRQNRAR